MTHSKPSFLGLALVFLSALGCGSGAGKLLDSGVHTGTDAGRAVDGGRQAHAIVDAQVRLDAARDADAAPTHVSAHDAGAADSGIADAGVGALPGWKLVWQDEFAGTAGSAPDQQKWVPEVGGNGWGNNELEFYTGRTQNASLDGQGSLVIKAIQESYMGRNYTSARLTTKGKLEQKYGRFEARIKLPAGQGVWPAFWMLGNDIDSVGWPQCGEIDIMENIGKEPGTVHGTLHGPGYGPGGSFVLPSKATFASDYHVFALEWELNTVRWYVDDQLYETRTPADLSSGQVWVFQHPFFIILNLAIGGTWPGNPDETAVFPQSMSIDYVRAYARP